MIAVIFEAWPNDGQTERYLRIAAELRPILLETEGFVSVERFQSLTDPRKILSLSFFQDESAVRRWREASDHRVARSNGRDGVFAWYRLRVADVVRDYSLRDRDQAPADTSP